MDKTKLEGLSAMEYVIQNQSYELIEDSQTCHCENGGCQTCRCRNGMMGKEESSVALPYWTKF